MLTPKEKGCRSFVEVLVGKGQPHKMAPASRGMVGILGTQKESVKKDQPLPRISGGQDGGDSLNFPSLYEEDWITFWCVKELFLSFKKQVERDREIRSASILWSWVC